MNRFSILSTSSEAIKLWAGHFKIVAILAILCSAPSLLLMVPSTNPQGPQPAATTALLSFMSAIMVVILTSMQRAALLGVLKNGSSADSIWPTAWYSIRTYIWTLVRVSLTLMVIAFLIAVPLGFVAAFFWAINAYAAQFLIIFIAILYLIFLKYALADPLVVLEDLPALDALKKSWKMTKGRFAYVFGCYVFLAVFEYSIGELQNHFFPSSRLSLASAVCVTITTLLDSIWIFMAWCMYQRIKSADFQPQTTDTSTAWLS
jgi:hypothetical protein